MIANGLLELLGEFCPLEEGASYTQLRVLLPLTATKVLLILPVFPVILPHLHMFLRLRNSKWVGASANECQKYKLQCSEQ